MSWFAVQLRRLADARTATAAIVGLTFVTSFLFGLAPRAIDAQASAALRSTVSAAPPETRNLAIDRTGRWLTGTDQLAVVHQAGASFEDRFPASVADLVKASYSMVDTPRFRSPGLEARTIRLRYLDGAADHIRIESGRLPTGETTEIPTPAGIGPGSTAFNAPTPPSDSLTTLEVAVSTASAHDLGVGVGSTLALATDETDKLAGWSIALIAIRIVGIYDVVEPGGDYWFGDTSLERPQVRSLSPLNQIDDVTVMIGPDGYGPLLAATAAAGLALHYTWRYEMGVERLTAANSAQILADLKRLGSVFLADTIGNGNSPAHPIGGLGPIALHGGLTGLVESYVAGWRGVSQTLSIVEVGGAAVAFLALGLVCLLAGRRRSGAIVLWLSRGASPGQLRWSSLVDAGVEVLPAAIAGGVVACLASPSGPVSSTAAASGAVLVFATALILYDDFSSSRDPALGLSGASGGNGTGGGGRGGAAGNSPSGRGRAAEGGRGLAAITRGATPRRLVIEASIVVGACAGAYVLRQRGLGAQGSGATPSGPDPLVAAVPVLIGGAAALMVVRLVPLPLEAFSRLMEKGRGLVALLALRRATRRTNDRLLLTALLTMAAVWAFAVMSLAYLDRASSAAGWKEVGADYRIVLQEGTLPPDFQLGELPGVETVAYATMLTSRVPEQNLTPSILALDVSGYRDVVRGGWPEGLLPGSMSDPPPGSVPANPSGAGTAAAGVPTRTSATLPAIVSSAFAAAEHLEVGDTIGVVVGGAEPEVRVAAIEDAFPTMTAGSAWLVVSRSGLAAWTGADIPPTEAFLRAGSGLETELGDALQARLPAQGFVASRYQAEAAIRGAPDYTAVLFGLGAASLAVAAYGALAVFAALALTGAEQSREAAHLRVLGVSRAQSLGLSAVEHGPASLLVLGAGIGLGLGLFEFLQPSLGLGDLVGGAIEVGWPLDALQAGLATLAICVLVGLAIALETAVQSIIKPAAALRRGMD